MYINRAFPYVQYNTSIPMHFQDDNSRLNQWQSLGCAAADFGQWSKYPIINTSALGKMNATFDRKKCCNIAEACGYVNACHNQSQRESNYMLVCDMFLARQCTWCYNNAGSSHATFKVKYYSYY